MQCPITAERSCGSGKTSWSILPVLSKSTMYEIRSPSGSKRSCLTIQIEESNSVRSALFCKSLPSMKSFTEGFCMDISLFPLLSTILMNPSFSLWSDRPNWSTVLSMLRTPAMRFSKHCRTVSALTVVVVRE